MRPRRTFAVNRLVVVALFIVALLVTGCAAGSDAPTDSAAAQPEPTIEASAADGSEETSAASEPADDQPSVNDAFTSPIGIALGFDPDDALALNGNYVRAAEELVRGCMATAGFDYVPQDPGFGPSFARQLELEQTISEENFVAEYGFGIATLFELTFQDEGVMLFVESLLGSPPVEVRTDSEEEAYQLALYGQTILGLSAEELQQRAFEVVGNQALEGSCRQVGYETAENPQGDIFDGLQSLLGDELDTLSDLFENDPRVRNTNTEWQSCMATFGYSYNDADEIRGELEGRADGIGTALQQSPEALAIFGAAIEANLTEMDRDSRHDFLERAGAFQGFTMVPGLQAELDALIAFELDVAQQSFDCADSDTLRQVRFGIEQDFVEAHADQLALIVAGGNE